MELLTASVDDGSLTNRSLRVVVVADPEGRERGQFWEQEIGLYNGSDLAKSGRTAELVGLVRLADDVARQHVGYRQFLINLLPQADMLVLNWDVLKGDPSFGGDVALCWLEHYQYVVRSWVYDGGILVIEGQANQSIPTQQSYDAVLGRSELRVSGAEDPLNARWQDERRTGSACVLTATARRSPLFHRVAYQRLELDKRDKQRSYDAHFPGDPDAPINPDHRIGPWPKMWRGWFIHRPLTRSRLRWVPIMRTADRRPTSQTTMLVAAHGKGAIFASTMYLALGQDCPLLFDVLLRCHGNTHQLPKPRGLGEFIATYSGPLLVLLAAVLFLLAWPQVFGGEQPADWVLYTATALLAFSLGLVRFVWGRLGPWLKDLLGR